MLRTRNKCDYITRNNTQRKETCTLTDKDFGGIIDVDDFNTEYPNPRRLSKFAAADRFNREMRNTARRIKQQQEERD